MAGPPDQNTSHAKPQPSSRDSPSKTIPGVRPSPLDGRPTTSTGAQSFDELLGGHAGLALGNSLLIEEHGTTDFAGSLLRYYAAEGVVQGHKVHVVGMDEQWARELPGLIGSTGDDGGKGLSPSADKEKMKIAWRYEKLGEFGAGARGGIAPKSPILPYVYTMSYESKIANSSFAILADTCSSSNVQSQYEASKPRRS